ncbi:hypothetical protein BCV69DRAFT_297811 [Microstroma glucosiphilum]|uniref:Uncharacterized protein n=1 Tax=Pseudomicrostroma glucosiphilum TaxID=1684307 RepID=A0A316UBF8_9BASI|nr:hypothetical protein BCV69DRAFT_297811 [Pseudomicrostroma glucosiphilum]PWN22526.1 hypothetical protein BCV69DRAFT_297811 [Pseudomicrostroma glucosiphilum]
MPKQSSGNWRKRRFPPRKKFAAPKKTSDEVVRPEKLPLRSASTSQPNFPAAPAGRQAPRITLPPSQSTPHHTSSPSRILSAAFAAVNTRNQRKFGSGSKDAKDTSDALEEWRSRNGVKPKIVLSAAEREERGRWAYSPDAPITPHAATRGPEWLLNALSEHSSQAPLGIQSSPPRSLAPIGSISTTVKSPFSDPGVSTVRHSQRPTPPAPSVPGFLGADLVAHHSPQTMQTGLPFTPPTPAAALNGFAHKPFAQPANGILRHNSSVIYTEDETLDWESALQRPSRSVTFDLPNFLSDVSADQKGAGGFGRCLQRASSALDNDTSLAEGWAAQELDTNLPPLSGVNDCGSVDQLSVPSGNEIHSDTLLFGQTLPANDVWTQDAGYADAENAVYRSPSPDLDYAPNHEVDFGEEGMYDPLSDTGEHW